MYFLILRIESEILFYSFSGRIMTSTSSVTVVVRFAYVPAILVKFYREEEMDKKVLE